MRPFLFCGLQVGTGKPLPGGQQKVGQGGRLDSGLESGLRARPRCSPGLLPELAQPESPCGWDILRGTWSRD